MLFAKGTPCAFDEVASLASIIRKNCEQDGEY